MKDKVTKDLLFFQDHQGWPRMFFSHPSSSCPSLSAMQFLLLTKILHCHYCQPKFSGSPKPLHAILKTKLSWWSSKMLFEHNNVRNHKTSNLSTWQLSQSLLFFNSSIPIVNCSYHEIMATMKATFLFQNLTRRVSNTATSM